MSRLAARNHLGATSNTSSRLTCHAVWMLAVGTMAIVSLAAGGTDADLIGQGVDRQWIPALIAPRERPIEPIVWVASDAAHEGPHNVADRVTYIAVGDQFARVVGTHPVRRGAGAAPTGWRSRQSVRPGWGRSVECGPCRYRSAAPPPALAPPRPRRRGIRRMAGTSPSAAATPIWLPALDTDPVALVGQALNWVPFAPLTMMADIARGICSGVGE